VSSISSAWTADLVIQSLPEGLGGFVAVFFHDGLNLFPLEPSVVEKLQVCWIGGARLSTR